jgi:hypothetical protein
MPTAETLTLTLLRVIQRWSKLTKILYPTNLKEAIINKKKFLCNSESFVEMILHLSLINDEDVKEWSSGIN